jgi:hypothetical protein
LAAIVSFALIYSVCSGQYSIRKALLDGVWGFRFVALLFVWQSQAALSLYRNCSLLCLPLQVKNLRGTLQEAEEAQIQQKKVYDDVVNERDVLGSQLIRRNDELALLYEKIKIQQSTLNKGELQV